MALARQFVKTVDDLISQTAKFVTKCIQYFNTQVCKLIRHTIHTHTPIL